MELKDIKIDKIEVINNVRVENRKEEIVGLMESINQNGLLQPIGVRKIGGSGFYQYVWGFRRLESCKKLGWNQIPAFILNKDEAKTEKDAVLLNMCENLHRKDVSPFELGRNCVWLKKDGLTTPEIAARLSLPKTKIRDAINLFSLSIPDDEKQNVVYMEKGGRIPKKGKIAASVMLELSKLKITSPQKLKKLIKLVRENEHSIEEIKHLGKLLGEGMDIERAVEELKRWSVTHCYFVCDKEKLEKLLLKNDCSIKELMIKIIKGKIPYENGLIWNEP